ncbi:hypothetical protein AAG906_017246 [Vitis piasezkii]
MKCENEVDGLFGNDQCQIESNHHLNTVELASSPHLEWDAFIDGLEDEMIFDYENMEIKFLNNVEWVLLVISNNLQILKSQQLILCNAACVKKQSMPLVFLARYVAYGYIVIVHLGLRSHLGRMAEGAATAENGGSQSHLSDKTAAVLDKILSLKGSAMLYMAHGGTNFGFYNGANIGADEFDYKPNLTSYDYDAPIRESSDVDNAKFKALRGVANRHSATSSRSVPSNTKKRGYGPIQLQKN